MTVVSRGSRETTAADMRATPSTPMRGNSAKAKSYAWCFQRMKEAHEAGFHLEAIALAESIITDRLLSFIRGALKNGTGHHVRQVMRRSADEVTLGPLIKCLEESAIEPGIPIGELDAWRRARNTLLHGLAKSDPDQPTKDLDGLLREASTAAQQGRRLARMVADWHRRELRAHKSNLTRRTL